MPCRWSRRCQAVSNADALPAPTSSPDVEDWKQIRKQNLRMMRKQTRSVLLLMALMEAMRVGPVQIVYAGRHGYPASGEDDYGIAYTAGYIFSYLYVCAFTIVFVPLFSWWIPKTDSDSEKSSVFHKIAKFLNKINMVLLPITIGMCLIQYVYHAIHAFVYVESRAIGSRKLPKNTRKNWLVRLMLLAGITMSLSFGYGAFQILEQMDLARVKTLEYALIVVPIQINIGFLFGTIMQFKMEKRIAMKKAKAEASAKVEEAIHIDEKAALLEV